MQAAGWPLPWQWFVAACLTLILRGWLIWQYGILEWPDSGGYIGVGSQLLAAPSLHQFIFGDVSVAGFRTIGYPLVLAAAMTLAGSAWPWAVVCFQIASLLWMLWWLYRLGIAMKLGRGFAAFIAAVFACSHLAIYEGSILTDAITTHLTVIAVGMLLVPLLEGEVPKIMPSMGVGLLLACAFLIREATLYLVPVLILALIAMAVGRKFPISGISRMVICVALPCILIWQAYLTWTEARTGYRGMATVGQSVYLMHPLHIEKRGQRVLQEPRLREAFEATQSAHIYGHALEINTYLAEKYSMNEWERVALSRTAYWQAWASAPMAMLLEGLRELRPKYAVRLTDISGNFINLNVTSEMVAQSSSSKESGVAKLIQLVFRVFSALIFAGCVFGVPAFILIPRLRRIAPDNLDVLAVCWLLFVTLTGMYAMIHMEFRHFLTVQAFAVVSGLVVLRHSTLLVWRSLRR